MEKKPADQNRQSMVKVYKKKAVKRSGDGADENDENSQIM